MNSSGSIRFWLVALALALVTTVATAGTSTVNINNPRIRLLPGDLPLAGYFDIHNSGKQAVSLTGASSPEFGMVMMHMSMHKNGEASMMMVDKIDIAPGKTVSFAPGGYHLMLMHRKKELKVGDKVLINLDFSNGHKMNVQFKVGGVDTQ
ncbi:MAG: copper chaperone PCu(A)C [Acidiferrobacterales bacterium]